MERVLELRRANAGDPCSHHHGEKYRSWLAEFLNEGGDPRCDAPPVIFLRIGSRERADVAADVDDDGSRRVLGV